MDDILKLSKISDNLLLINPDNPSGNFIKKEDLLILADKLQEMGKNFILDESFVDFSTNGEKETMITQEIIDMYPNLVIIKSISKSYGVPGIRLGVLVSSNKKIISSIQDEVSIWNINSYGEFFLQIIGKYKKEYKKASLDIALERDRFYSRLQEVSFLEPIYSQANYFLVYVTDQFTATELAELLLYDDNLYIKDLTGKIGFEGKECIRIAVKNYEDNEVIVSTLKKLTEEN